MRVARAVLTGPQSAAGRCLAETRLGDTVYRSYLSGSDPEAIAAECGADLVALRQIGGGFLAVLNGGTAAPDAEMAMFEGRRVVFGLRNGETPQAAADWLAWHAASGAEVALIFDRAPPEDAGFAAALEAMDGPALPDVMVVQADAPLGREGAPDARDPASAPAARGGIADALANPWHAPFAETILLETLRRRFLGAARSVAFLDVADLLLPADGPSVFDRAEAAGGCFVLIEGRERYPWRLRKGRPAPHADHVFARLDEPRFATRWCVAPALLAEDTAWRMIRIGGAAPASGGPGRFLRAMGVIYPGAPVERLVARSGLVEDHAASGALEAGFRVTALRGSGAAPAVGTPARTDEVVIVTAMKNEGPFILDWLAHHRAAGIRQVLVYTNDCEDGTDSLLDALAAEGVVTHRENPYRARGGVPQHAAFRAAEDETLVRDAGWLLTLDVDEYVNIHAGEGRLADLFGAVPEANAISMPWRLFGNGDVERFEDRPVTQQFHACAPEYCPRPHQAWGFKTFYRNAGLFRRLGVHRPRGIEPSAMGAIRWVDGSGRPLPPGLWRSGWRMTEACWGYGLVSVNHYALRSAESFLVKRDRGRVNHTERDQGTAYWFRMNHNADDDRSIRRFDARVAAERAALAALPGVAEAHERAVGWHRLKIAELRAIPEFAELYSEITGPRLRKLSRMLAHFGANVFLAGPSVIPDEVAARAPGGDWRFTVAETERRD